MTEPLLDGLPPVIDDRARVLILGSFPSVRSLAEGRYYANPRNAFWPIVAELFGFDCTATYSERLAALQSHNVALWDVVRSCRRAGSADAAIDRKTLVINDFDWLFGSYPRVTPVVLQRGGGGQAVRADGALPGGRDVPTAALDEPGSRHCAGGETRRVDPAYRCRLMTPAAAAVPTAGRLRSARTTTAASPRHRAGRPVAPTSAARRRRSPTAPPPRAAR